jgi:hypothetical protein
MNPDRETDMANIQSLIALWQDEEKRLRSIIKDPQTSPTIQDQVREIGLSARPNQRPC